MSNITDPIADFLTRIRNAIIARHHRVDIPASKMKRELTKILLDEGYIRDYINIEDSKQGIIRIFLKYDRNGKNTITGIRRISKPGLRQYVGATEIPRVRNGLGVPILSTPKGLLTGLRAKHENVGGEVICFVW